MAALSQAQRVNRTAIALRLQASFLNPSAPLFNPIDGFSPSHLHDGVNLRLIDYMAFGGICLTIWLFAIYFNV